MLLYPAKCPFCGVLNEGICDKCGAELVKREDDTQLKRALEILKSK